MTITAHLEIVTAAANQFANGSDRCLQIKESIKFLEDYVRDMDEPQLEFPTPPTNQNT